MVAMLVGGDEAEQTIAAPPNRPDELTEIMALDALEAVRSRVERLALRGSRAIGHARIFAALRRSGGVSCC
jgi:hypothetical protein